MPRADDVARDLTDLKRKLRLHGLPGADEAAVIGGFPDEHDMLVAFADSDERSQAIAFSSKIINEAGVHAAIVELTSMRLLSTRKLGPRTVTFYKR